MVNDKVKIVNDIVTNPLDKQICSPESTTVSEEINKTADNSNNNLANSKNFDLRQVLNWKKYLNMDKYKPPLLDEQPRKNLAQMRMAKLQEELKIKNANIVFPKTEILAIHKSSPSKKKSSLPITKPKTRDDVSRNLTKNFINTNRLNNFVNFGGKQNMNTKSLSHRDFVSSSNYKNSIDTSESSRSFGSQSFNSSPMSYISHNTSQSSEESTSLLNNGLNNNRKRKYVDNETELNIKNLKYMPRDISQTSSNNKDLNNIFKDDIQRLKVHSREGFNEKNNLQYYTCDKIESRTIIPNNDTNSKLNIIQNNQTNTNNVRNDLQNTQSLKLNYNGGFNKKVSFNHSTSDKSETRTATPNNNTSKKSTIQNYQKNTNIKNDEQNTHDFHLKKNIANQRLKNLQKTFENNNLIKPSTNRLSDRLEFKSDSSQVKKNFSVNNRLTHVREQFVENQTKQVELVHTSPNLNNKHVSTDCDEVSMELEQDIESHKSLSQEQMEWETITEEKILKSVHNIRQELSETKLSLTPQINESSINKIQNNSQESRPHIIVDTNIFLSHLSFLKHILLDYNFENLGRPIVIVPWMVLQELDYIKDRENKSSDNSKLGLLARKAISFLNNAFAEKNPNLYGQNAVESSKELFPIETSDDKILNCCLQTKDKSQNVILLSNDQNLRTKSMINQISAFSKDDILQSIKKMADVRKNMKLVDPRKNQRKSLTNKVANESENVLKESNVLKHDDEDCSRIDKYVHHIAAFYVQFCTQVVEIKRKYDLGVEIDKKSEVIRIFPDMLSSLSALVEVLSRVTLEPYYNVKMQSLRDFGSQLQSVLKLSQMKCDGVDVKEVGIYCRREREKLVDLGKHLKPVLKILHKVRVLFV